MGQLLPCFFAAPCNFALRSVIAILELFVMEEAGILKWLGTIQDYSLYSSTLCVCVHACVHVKLGNCIEMGSGLQVSQRTCFQSFVGSNSSQCGLFLTKQGRC